MACAGGGRGGHEQFQVVDSGGKVSVLLRNGFALLSHAQAALQRAGGKRFHEEVRWSRATSYGAATAMEEHRLNAARQGGLRQLGLSAMKCPLAGENTT